MAVEIGKYLDEQPKPVASEIPGALGGADPLEQLKTWFRESEDALFTSRKSSERTRDFVDGKQWTHEEEQALRRRGQAAIVFNRMRQKVDTLVGVEQEMRADPKAYPRTPQHEEEADTATDALRYVCDNNRFDAAASFVFDQGCCVEGVSGVEVIVEYGRRGGEPEIAIKEHPFDRIGWDPHSRRPDFGDARYVHTIHWMDGAQAQRQWPHAAEFIAATIAAAPITSRETYEDTPRYWADRTRNRVQVVQMWWREGEAWWVATFVHGGFLEEPQESPYLDEDGEPSCALILCSGYVTREGERYGAANVWIGAQEDINKRRSKALHLLSVRQTIADPGVIKDVRVMKSELARPDGHVNKDVEGDFAVLPTGDMAAGQMELLREAKAEIDSTGPTAHSLVPGDGLAQSGIAVQAQQHGQMLPLSLLLEHHREWKLRVYRAIWARVRQFWRAPRWLRVTDNPESLRWVGLNQPVTLGQQIEQEQGPLPPQYQGDPRLQMVAGIQNQPAAIDVDIIVDEGPDIVTTVAQEFELLVRLYEANPQAIPFVALIQASPLRAKDQLLEMMEGGAEGAAQAQAQQAEMTARAILAQIQRTEADALLKQAQAQQTMAETPSEIEYNEARADQATATAAEKAAGIGANVVALTGGI